MSISSLRGIVSRVMPTRRTQAPAPTAARVDYAKIAQAAEDKARTFQHGKGKNTARERLAQLLDHHGELGDARAVPAALLGQVDRVQALAHQLIPGARPLAGGQAAGVRPALRDGVRARREGRDRLGQVLKVRFQC